MALEIKVIEVDGREIKVGESYYGGGGTLTTDTVDKIYYSNIRGVWQPMIQLSGETFYFHYVKAEEFWTEYQPLED